MKRITVGLTLLLLALTASAVAQQLAGRIEGGVTDPTGAVLPGASITATHVATNTIYRATTSQIGRFVIPSVRLGRYTIAVEASGFGRGVVTDVLVEVGGTASVNITLEVGALEVETVVTADTSQQIINTVDAELGVVVDERRVLELPLNGRNAIELMFLQAGVFQENDKFGQGGQLVIHGQRDSSLNITLNGVDVQDQISRVNSIKLQFPLLMLAAENVQEFRVVTGIGSAEFSRGGAQVSAVTRGGGNDWHGSIFEFHRNDKLSANTFFNNRSGLPTPKLIRNQFGGRVGGPIVKDKTFFFFGYEQTRESRAIPQLRLVYTAEARQGRFRYFDSDGSIVEVNLFECGANVQATIGQDCVDSRFNLGDPIISGGALTPDPFLASAVWDTSVVPLANDFSFGDGLNTAGFRFNASSTKQQHLPSFRLDHLFSDKHSFYATYNYTDRDIGGDFVNGRLPRFPSQGPLGSRITHARGYTAALTSAFTPTLVNEARFGVLIGDNRFQVNQPFDTPFVLDFEIEHPDPTGDITGADRFIYDHNNQTESRITETWHVRDVASWVKGNHQFKFGGEFRHRYVNFVSFDAVNAFGEIDFNNSDNDPGLGTGDLRDMAGAISSPSSTLRNTAEEMLNDFLGAIGDVERRYNVRSLTDTTFDLGLEERRILQNRELDLFFNDTWRAFPNLTVNLGLRWEYSSVPVETRGLILNLESFDDIFGVSGRAGLFNPGVFAGHGCDPALFSGDLSNLNFANPTRTDVNNLRDGCATRYVPGTATNGRPLWEDNYNNFGPVISLAWDPWGDGKSVVRAGFRLSYIQDAFGIVERNLDDNEGLVRNITCTPVDGDCQNNIGPNALLRDLIGSGTPEEPAGGTPIAPVPTFQLPAFATIQDSTSIDFRTFDNNLKTSYYEEWTFGIQHEILPDTALEVRYVGNRGVGLRTLKDFNEYNITAPSQFISPFTGQVGQTFAQAFLAAQINLACNRLNMAGPHSGNNFLDQGLGCSMANPLMDALIFGDVGELDGDSQMIDALDRNEAGEFLDELTIDQSTAPSPGESEPRGGAFWGAVLRGDIPLNFFRVNPFVMSARGMVNDGFSTYHALEVELRKRMSHGLLLQANYTYGRALTDDDGAGATLFTQKPSPVRNPRSTYQEWAPRHQFNANWVYEFPVGPGKAFAPENAVARKLLEGWQTSGLIRWRSGRPLSFISGLGSFLAQSESDANTPNLSTSLSTGDLRDMTGQQNIPLLSDPTLTGVFWIDPCTNGDPVQGPPPSCTDPNAIQGLFIPPNVGEIGTLKQTPIFGPTRFIFDFGLMRRIKITETVNVEFRWEVFNITNTANFDIPNLDISVSSVAFGQILDTITNPRLMQFALKINF